MPRILKSFNFNLEKSSLRVNSKTIVRKICNGITTIFVSEFPKSISLNEKIFLSSYNNYHVVKFII